MSKFDILLARCGGSFLPRVDVAAAILDYPSPGAARSAIHQKSFPIPVKKIGGTNHVNIFDLAEFLGVPADAGVQGVFREPRRRGRPTKQEQLARMQSGGVQ